MHPEIAMTTMRKAALVLSPFSTFPADAGQRKRALQSTTMFRELGYDITFLFYAFEEGWRARYNSEFAAGLHQQWGEVIIFKANRRVGAKPTSNGYHKIDDWWDDELANFLANIFDHRSFDLFVVHNVWLSKALDFAPNSTLKIIEAHDVFSVRRRSFEKLEIAPEFFIPSREEEIFGANRADIVITIQELEQKWFSDHGCVADVMCLPYYPQVVTKFAYELTPEYVHPDKVVFGFLGSGHIFNIKGLTAFREALELEIGKTDAPVEIKLGGRVCDFFPGRGAFTCVGYIKDEGAFYEDVDFSIAPVFDGTGFKIKTADSIAFGKPILLSRHSAIGLDVDQELVVETPSELAKKCVQIALHRPSLSQYHNKSASALVDLAYRTGKGRRAVQSALGSHKKVVVYDLRGLTDAQAATVLLSWSGLFHLYRAQARQVILSTDATWVSSIVANAPPSLFEVSEIDIVARTSEVRLWLSAGQASGCDLSGAADIPLLIDDVWLRAFDYHDATFPTGALLVGQVGGSFWHNLAWDPMIASIAGVLAGAEAIRGSKIQASSVYAFSTRRATVLAPLLTSIDNSAAVADCETSAGFFGIVLGLIGGGVKSLYVDYSISAGPKVLILKALATAVGCEVLGMAASGAFLNTSYSGGAATMFKEYELGWRSLLDSFPSGSSHQPRRAG